MKNMSNESSIPLETIPLETMVVDYVSGRLTGNARTQFEANLNNDPELLAAVEFERMLRGTANDINKRSGLIASNKFEDLLERIEEHDRLEQDFTDQMQAELTAPDNHQQQAAATRSNFKLQIAASIALAGVIGVLLLGPVNERYLSPSFQTLSTSEQVSLDLPSLVSESRIAKVILAEPLETDAVASMLAAYQLQLVSQVPEQNGLIVLAKQSIEPAMLNGLRNDNRIADVTLVSVNAETQ